MSVSENFIDLIHSFEMIKSTLSNISLPELHKLAHRYNDAVDDLVRKLDALAHHATTTNEERLMHLCRMEKAEEIVLAFALEIDSRIRQAA